MKTNLTKFTLSVAFAAIGSMCKELAVPFFVLCVLMIADHITGMVKSWQLGTLCSRTGIKGFIKKLCYGLAVVAAIGIDYVIVIASSKFGYDIGVQPFFGWLCTAWLIINECISILENLSAMGVPMPTFLAKAAKKLKNNVECAADNTKESDENKERENENKRL